MSSSSAPFQSRTAARTRRATPADKEDYVNVHHRGYELDPQFRWRYPRRHEFREDAKKSTGDIFDAVLKMENSTCVVAELPKIESGGSESETEWVIAAIAVWAWKDLAEVENESAPAGFSAPNSGRRDMDSDRQKLFIDKLTAAEKQYFGPSLGLKRLELADCVADPKYHRRGAGKALIEWGQAMAREAHVPIQLTSSPMGASLYQKMGFRELAYVECLPASDEEERIGFGVMVWLPDGWESDSLPQHV